MHGKGDNYIPLEMGKKTGWTFVCAKFTVTSLWAEGYDPHHGKISLTQNHPPFLENLQTLTSPKLTTSTRYFKREFSSIPYLVSLLWLVQPILAYMGKVFGKNILLQNTMKIES